MTDEADKKIYRLSPLENIINVDWGQYLVAVYWEWSDYGYDGIDVWAVGGGTTTLDVEWTVHHPVDEHGDPIGDYWTEESHYEPTLIAYSVQAATPSEVVPYNLKIQIPKQNGVKWLNPAAKPEQDIEGYNFREVFTTPANPPVDDPDHEPTPFGYQYGSFEQDALLPRPDSTLFAQFHTEFFYFTGGQHNFDSGKNKKSDDNIVGDILFKIEKAVPAVDIVSHRDGPFFAEGHFVTNNTGDLPPGLGDGISLPPNIGTPGDFNSIQYVGSWDNFTGICKVGRANSLGRTDSGIGFTAIIYSLNDFKYDKEKKKIVLKDPKSKATPLSITSTNNQEFKWEDGPKSGPFANQVADPSKLPNGNDSDNAIISFRNPPAPNQTEFLSIVPKGFNEKFIFRMAKKTVPATKTTKKKTVPVLWPYKPASFAEFNTPDPNNKGKNLPFPYYRWRLGDNKNNTKWSGAVGFGKPPIDLPKT